MKHKTAELTGALLDAAVAMAEGLIAGHSRHNVQSLPFSSSWLYGGPIIDRERISLVSGGPWLAYMPPAVMQNIRDGLCDGDGPTPLIAAMRAYVASKLGDEVELP